MVNALLFGPMVPGSSHSLGKTELTTHIVELVTTLVNTRRLKFYNILVFLKIKSSSIFVLKYIV